MNNYTNFTITTAGQAIIDAAVSSNQPIANYTLWTKDGNSTFDASTTNIPGLEQFGIPSIATTLGDKDVFIIAYLQELKTYPRTVAVMFGSVLGMIANINVRADNSTWILKAQNVSSKAFVESSRISNDLISADSLSGVLDEVSKIYSDNYPALFAGQTLFGGGFGQKPQAGEILVEVAAVENDQEFQTATQNSVSMAEVFNTWKRFSHQAAAFPSNEAVPAELNAWSYDQPNDLIRCTVNSLSFIGFISPQNYRNYDLDVTLGSTDQDDDNVGIILAANYVGAQLWTLSLWRSTGGTAKYHIYYGASYNSQYTVAQNPNIMKWGNGNFGNTAAEAGYVTNQAGVGWSGSPLGVRIRVERRGDIIKVWSSQLNETTLMEESLLQVDLAADPRLAKFRNGSRYGYSSSSQKDSYYKVASFIDRDRVVADLRDGKVYSFDGTNWVVDSSKVVTDVIKPGRFCYSTINKKLYFRDATSGTLIALTH